jgi:uncharacterized protein (DUF433 family)
MKTVSSLSSNFVNHLWKTVKQVVELLEVYPDRSELFQEFPELEDEDIRQAIITDEDRQNDATRPISG